MSRLRAGPAFPGHGDGWLRGQGGHGGKGRAGGQAGDRTLGSPGEMSPLAGVWYSHN